MEKDVKIFGYLPNLIEIPADVLLYWTLKAVDFKGAISEQDLQKYRDAISRAYRKFKSNISEELAFNFPYADNYQHAVFEEVILANGKTGFRLVKAKGKTAKELLEYRLVKLESFSRVQKPIVREMFSLAEQYYRMEQPAVSYMLQPEPTIKQKVLKLARNIKQKFNVTKKK